MNRNTKRRAGRSGNVLQKIKNAFVSVLRTVGRGIYLGIRKLYRLPAKTVLLGVGTISVILIVVLIISIASRKNTNSVVSTLPSGDSLIGEMIPDTEESFILIENDPDDGSQTEPDDSGYQEETDPVQGSVSDPEPDAQESQTEPSVEESADFEKLEGGDKSPVVAEIQLRLMELGYMDSDEPTEYFGTLTEKALSTFQTHNGLKADAICGSSTYSLLMSKDAKEYVMQSGDSGEEVQNVQQRLYELGYVTETSNVTGTFGDKTKEAVEEFQKKNKLKQDGKVGSATLEALFSESPVSKCYSIGDVNDVIKKVQQRLKKLNYYEGKDNGEYTKATATAVKKFQRLNDLIVDGTLGPSTKTAILSSDAKAYVMQLGDSGNDVKKVQTRLSKLNYLRAANATGYFGEKTEEAVVAFQKRNSLHADGKVGSGTYDSLFSSSAKKAKTVSTNTGGTSSSDTGNGSGSSNSGNSGTGTSGSSSKGVEKLIEIANTKKGCKYVSGAKGPNTFDCSGFVYWCLKQSGVSISYMTSIAWRSTTRFTRIDSLSSCKRGDILVFSGSTMAAGHVGIYLGSGSMIDAGSSAGCVRITNTVTSGSYWPSHFLMGYRIF